MKMTLQAEVKLVYKLFLILLSALACFSTFHVTEVMFFLSCLWILEEYVEHYIAKALYTYINRRLEDVS